MAVTEPIRPFSPPPTHRSNHQPLPARFHSSYSELSANVAFLSEIKSQSTSSSKGSSAENFSEPSTPAATSRALQPESRLETSTVTPTEPPTNRLATQPRPIVRRKNLPDGERRNGTPSPRASGNLKMLSGKKGNDVRRQPSLACFFCRERKIACGRPAEGSVDRTCKYVYQCRLITWKLADAALSVSVPAVRFRAITQQNLCVVSTSGERLIRMVIEVFVIGVILYFVCFTVRS